MPYFWRQLASERQERGVWGSRYPGAPGVESDEWSAARKVALTGLLLMAANAVREVLGLPIRIISLGGKMQAEGAFGGTLGL